MLKLFNKHIKKFQKGENMEINNSLTPIHDFLIKNKEDCKVRCYMPGHKGYEHPLDITEIDGADSLYDADPFSNDRGIIGQSELIASRVYGTEQTLYSCGGSTLAIQTMLALAKSKGKGRDHVIAGRYSHRSFINTCILLGLIPSWVYPKEYMSCALSPSDIEKKITERTLAVFINSIDYYGGMNDIRAISEVCRKHDIPLLVDNAHGAYLRFTEADRHPISLGADMCADSAHKTLPVLTGGAYLHIGNKRFCDNAKETMSLFGSSSPSYLILDSLDRFNATVCEYPDHIKNLVVRIKELKRHISASGYILSESDDMRITFDCRAMFTTGQRFAYELDQFGVTAEYADDYKCVLLLGWHTSDQDFETLYMVFAEGVMQRTALFKLPKPPVMIKTTAASAPGVAYNKMKQTMKIEEAEGKICGSVIAPCPPGIPLLMPGEVITKEAIDVLMQSGVTKIDTTVGLRNIY